MKTKIHLNGRAVITTILLLMSAAFTQLKAQTAYAIWCPSTATMYFTTSTATIKAGQTYGGAAITNVWSGNLVEDSGSQPQWNVTVRSNLKKVVFDQSFQDIQPKSCSEWFYRCKLLQSVEGLKYLNTASATSMMEMFRECEQLSSLDISQFNTHNVTSMENMFNGCKLLGTLDVSNFDSFNAESTKNMFAGCESLSKLTLFTILKKNFTCSYVENMEGMFNGCKNLTELDVTNLRTTNVTNMNYMFNECKKLKTLDLRNFKTNSLTMSSYMFANCSALTQIMCNDTWKAGTSTSMFLNCWELQGAISYDPQKINISYANPTNGYFYDCVDYGLNICGTRVNSRNCNDLSLIDGVRLTNSSGKATYNNRTYTLTLKDVEIKASSGNGIDSSISGLTIRFEGKTTIDAPNGMELNGNTTLTANRVKDVDLNIKTSTIGIIVGNGTLTITGGLDCLIESNLIGISGVMESSKFKGSLKVNDGNTWLHVICKNAGAIGMLDNIQLDDGLAYSYPTGAHIGGGYNEVVDQNGNTAKEVIINNINAPVYYLTVCGNQVTGKNCKDLTSISGVSVGSGGYFNYDPETNTLNMKDVEIRGTYEYLLNCFSHDLTINVEGENSIYQRSEDTGGTALGIQANTTITGSGTLDCFGSYNGPGIYLSDTLIINGAKVETFGHVYGIKGEYIKTYYGYYRYGVLIIKEGDGKLTAKGRTSCIHGLASIQMDENVIITSPEGAAYGSWDVDLNGETVKNQDVVIETPEIAYDLYIFGTQLTNKNCSDLMTLPTVSRISNQPALARYDDKNKILTLMNVALYGETADAIKSSIPDLTIYVRGVAQLNSKRFGMSLMTSTTIKSSGNGKLFVNSDNVGIYIGDATLKIEDMETTINANSYGIIGTTSTNVSRPQYYATLWLTGKKTKLSSNGGSGSIINLKDLVLGDGLRITSPAGATFASHSVRGTDGKDLAGKAVVIELTSLTGDVNQDGKVDISDIVAVINTIAGDTTYKSTADVNSDNKIDISDIVAIINIIAGN